MTGIRFYLEYENKTEKNKGTRKTLGNHTGNVVAVLYKNCCPDFSLEAISAIYFYRNSPVASTSVSYNYLQERCKRISEQQARKIHPNLFFHLDDN